MIEPAVPVAVCGACGVAYACTLADGAGGVGLGSGSGGVGDGWREPGRSLSTNRPAFFFAFLTNPLIVSNRMESVQRTERVQYDERESAVLGDARSPQALAALAQTQAFKHRQCLPPYDPTHAHLAHTYTEQIRRANSATNMTRTKAWRATGSRGSLAAHGVTGRLQCVSPHRLYTGPLITRAHKKMNAAVAEGAPNIWLDAAWVRTGSFGAYG